MTEALHPVLKAIIKKKLPARLAHVEKVRSQTDYMELIAPLDPVLTNDTEKVKQCRERYLKTIQGHSGAQYNLGLMYRSGHGVEKDFEQAAYCLYKTALHGGLQEQRIFADTLLMLDTPFYWHLQ